MFRSDGTELARTTDSYDLVRGDEGPLGFSGVEQEGARFRLVRVRLDGPVPVLERARWTTLDMPLAVSPDGRLVAVLGIEETTSGAGRVDVVDRVSGRVRATLLGRSPIAEVAFSPDSARLAALHGDWSREGMVDVSDVQPEPGPPMGVEVVELASGRIRHWGENPRSRLRRRARVSRGVR